MYSINYKKEINFNKGIFGNIDSLTIDKDDILMMKNIDLIHGGDKNLVLLYLQYLKYCHKNKESFQEYTILNNSKANEQIISSIIYSDWLINFKSIDNDPDEYLAKREMYLLAIEKLSGSKNSKDERRRILMQYFVDSIDKVMIEKEGKVKKISDKRGS